MHTIAMSCAHQLGDISRGLHASSRRCRPMVGNIKQGLHKSDVVWAYLGSDVRQRYVTSSKICTHNSLRVCISLETWTSAKRQAQSAKACALWASNICQRLKASNRACTYLAWHVHIWQATLANEMQKKPRLACIGRGVCS